MEYWQKKADFQFVVKTKSDVESLIHKDGNTTIFIVKGTDDKTEKLAMDKFKNFIDQNGIAKDKEEEGNDNEGIQPGMLYLGAFVCCVAGILLAKNYKNEKGKAKRGKGKK